MTSTTPLYSIPYPESLDEPDAPGQLESLANLLETVFQRIDTTASTQGGTLDSLTASLNAHVAASTAHGVSGAIVGTTGTQTLTGKTIDGHNNTLTVLGSQIVGAPASGFVGINEGATLTGKVMSGLNNTFSNIPQTAVLLTDTQSTSFTVNGGWALSSGVAIARKVLGRFVYIEHRVQRTGATITAGSDGNISNVIISSIPSAYRPISTVGMHWVSTQSDGGGYLQSDGQIVLSTMNPGSQIANGHIVFIRAFFMV